MIKSILVATGAALVGNYVFERFLAKNTVTGTGFIEIQEGLGLDDVARAATIGVAIVAAKRFLG